MDLAIDPEVGAVDLVTDDAVAALSSVFSTVDHVALAEAQASCKDVRTYKEGKQERNLKFEVVEFVPGTNLWCEVSSGRARPIVPATFRELIFRAFHNIRQSRYQSHT